MLVFQKIFNSLLKVVPKACSKILGMYEQNIALNSDIKQLLNVNSLYIILGDSRN